MASNNSQFLCRRMKELREKNNLTMDDMAKLLHKANKSSISRGESGKTSYSTLIALAKEYCELFNLDSVQTEQFLRSDKVVVPDTSALLINTQLIDELGNEYSRIVIPKIVINELDNIKNTNSGSLGRKAWEILNSMKNGDKILVRDYVNCATSENNDCKIISIAENAALEFGCRVDIITNDVDYSVYLKGNETVKALNLREYIATKQAFVNIAHIREIDNYYSSSYDDLQPPTYEEVNAYFDNGNTLIISTVRNKHASLNEKKAKISWLIKNGADIDKRDCSRRYFPPLSHAIQMGDYDMFMFLLKECNANPNIASRNPYDSGKVRQKNEGNMPLMIAAWEGKEQFVKVLCEDPRTSINQQDANGFTALIKASANKYFKCKDILLKYGANEKIVDINGKTYLDHINDSHEFGPLRKRGRGYR